MLRTKVRNYLARYFRTGTKPIWQSGLSRSTYPFPQDLKRSPIRTLLTASLNRGATPWEWTEARIGVRLLGRAMLGQTVMVAFIYGFMRMLSRTTWPAMPNRRRAGPKLPS